MFSEYAITLLLGLTHARNFHSPYHITLKIRGKGKIPFAFGGEGSSGGFPLFMFFVVDRLKLTSRYKNVVCKCYSKRKTGRRVTVSTARPCSDVAVLLRLRLCLQ